MNPQFTELIVQPFVYQFWQVSTLVAIVAVIASFVGNRRPHLAYLLWLLVAVKCVTPPLVGSPTSVFSMVRSDSHTPASGNQLPSNADLETGFTEAAFTNFGRESAMNRDFPMIHNESPPAIEAMKSPVWDWKSLVVFAWGCGALFYVAYLAMHWWRFQRIVSHGKTPEGVVARIYNELIRESKFRHPPKLIQVEEPFGPAVVGCFIPKIILPSRLVEEASESELQSILYHELSHVRRGDVWMAWLQVAAGTVWWFHPFIWYANRQIVRWREASCDEEVIARLSIQPRRYADALLRVLEARIQPFPAMQIGMAVGESTERRLVRLMKRTGYCQSTPAWCWLVAALASLTVLPGAAWSWQTDEASVKDEAAQVVLQPVGADAAPQITGQLMVVGKPVDTDVGPEPEIQQTLTLRGTAMGPDVSGATVTLLRTRGDDVTGSAVTRTDSAGKFEFEQKFEVDRVVPIPRERVTLHGKTSNGVSVWKEWEVTLTPNGLELVEVADDFAPFAYFVLNDQPAQKLKEKKSVAIELSFPTESSTLSGMLRDPAGDPVTNAVITTVAVVKAPGPTMGLDLSAGNASPMVSFPTQAMATPLRDELRVSTRTNANGEWTLGKFGVGETFDIAAVVPGFAMTVSRVKTVGERTSVESNPVESKKCIVTVLDDLTGEPVPLANVRVSKLLQKEPRRTAHANGVTDRRGRIALDLPTGKSQLLLTPNPKDPKFGYRTTKAIGVDTLTRELEVRMLTGTLLDFRVVDDATGNPVPFMPVRATPIDPKNMMITQTFDGTDAKKGKTLFAALKGKAKISVPGAAHQGYEIVNPIEEPLEIEPGRKWSYTFRLRRMSEFRVPVQDDNTADFPERHQTAVSKLRELGAVVSTQGNLREAHCEVYLTQFWKGEPEDLKWLAELEFFKVLHCIAYPVPKTFHATQKPEPPLVTDEWLREIGKASLLSYLYIAKSTITDDGLASMAGSKSLEQLILGGSRVEGRGIESLRTTPLQSLRVVSDSFGNLADVDLTAFRDLSMLDLESTNGRAIVPPKAGKKLIHARIVPANARTFDRLDEYPGLGYLFVEGLDVNDEVLKRSPVIRRVEMLSLENTSVTDAGLSTLTPSRLSSVRLAGKQFTDAAARHLRELPRLRLVTLKDTSVTAQGIELLKSDNNPQRQPDGRKVTVRIEQKLQ